MISAVWKIRIIERGRWADHLSGSEAECREEFAALHADPEVLGAVLISSAGEIMSRVQRSVVVKVQPRPKPDAATMPADAPPPGWKPPPIEWTLTPLDAATRAGMRQPRLVPPATQRPRQVYQPVARATRKQRGYLCGLYRQLFGGQPDSQRKQEWGNMKRGAAADLITTYKAAIAARKGRQASKRGAR